MTQNTVDLGTVGNTVASTFAEQLQREMGDAHPQPPPPPPTHPPAAHGAAAGGAPAQAANTEGGLPSCDPSAGGPNRVFITGSKGPCDGTYTVHTDPSGNPILSHDRRLYVKDQRGVQPGGDNLVYHLGVLPGHGWCGWCVRDNTTLEGIYLECTDAQTPHEWPTHVEAWWIKTENENWERSTQVKVLCSGTVVPADEVARELIPSEKNEQNNAGRRAATDLVKSGAVSVYKCTCGVELWWLTWTGKEKQPDDVYFVFESILSYSTCDLDFWL